MGIIIGDDLREDHTWFSFTVTSLWEENAHCKKSDLAVISSPQLFKVIVIVIFQKMFFLIVTVTMCELLEESLAGSSQAAIMQ